MRGTGAETATQRDVRREQRRGVGVRGRRAVGGSHGRCRRPRERHRRLRRRRPPAPEMSEPSAPAPSGARTDAARTPATAADRPPRQHRDQPCGLDRDLRGGGRRPAAGRRDARAGALRQLRTPAPATPGTDSVDAGFARDMIVHHDQGVLMAHYAEENTDRRRDRRAGLRHRLHADGTARPDAGLAGAVGPAGIQSRPRTWPGWPAPTRPRWPRLHIRTCRGRRRRVRPRRCVRVGEGGALMPGMATNEEIAKLRA